jgi:hypothetical protein
MEGNGGKRYLSIAVYRIALSHGSERSPVDWNYGFCFTMGEKRGL